MVASEHRGTVLVVSGPSGAGKTTVCRALLAAEPNLAFSVSCTTRAPRAGEVPGVDYHFLSHEQFQQRIREDAFLEYAEVHGNLYGTLRSEVEDRVLADGDVLLDIDVQGGSVLRRRLTGTPLEAVTAYVFLGPPSYEVLIERLHLRGTDHPEVIRLRLENARHELQSWRSYDYVIAIHDVEYTVERLRAVLLSQRCRVNRFVQAPWERGEETADGSRI